MNFFGARRKVPVNPLDDDTCSPCGEVIKYTDGPIIAPFTCWHRMHLDCLGKSPKDEEGFYKCTECDITIGPGEKITLDTAVKDIYKIGVSGGILTENTGYYEVLITSASEAYYETLQALSEQIDNINLALTQTCDQDAVKSYTQSSEKYQEVLRDFKRHEKRSTKDRGAVKEAEDEIANLRSTLKEPKSNYQNCFRFLFAQIAKILNFEELSEAFSLWLMDRFGREELILVDGREVDMIEDNLRSYFDFLDEEKEKDSLKSSCTVCLRQISPTDGAILAPMTCHHSMHQACLAKLREGNEYFCNVCSRLIGPGRKILIDHGRLYYYIGVKGGVISETTAFYEAHIEQVLEDFKKSKREFQIDIDGIRTLISEAEERLSDAEKDKLKSEEKYQNALDALKAAEVKMRQDENVKRAVEKREDQLKTNRAVYKREMQAAKMKFVVTLAEIFGYENHAEAFGDWFLGQDKDIEIQRGKEIKLVGNGLRLFFGKMKNEE